MQYAFEDHNQFEYQIYIVKKNTDLPDMMIAQLR